MSQGCSAVSYSLYLMTDLANVGGLVLSRLENWFDVVLSTDPVNVNGHPVSWFDAVLVLSRLENWFDVVLSTDPLNVNGHPVSWFDVVLSIDPVNVSGLVSSPLFEAVL